MNEIVDKIIALILLIPSIPLWIIFYVLIKFDSKGPFIFKQKRVGKDKKVFTMYKFRTMVENAESLRKKYLSLNEVDGPVFKIANDPRYTKIGKYLSHIGLDELPQFWNVMKGEMALVGPRPLPLDEAIRIPARFNKRFTVLPGITSLWIVRGGHELTFSKRMELDTRYVAKKSLALDLYVLFHTIVLISKKTILIMLGKI